jgi:hypothetical protein
VYIQWSPCYSNRLIPNRVNEALTLLWRIHLPLLDKDKQTAGASRSVLSNLGILGPPWLAVASPRPDVMTAPGVGVSIV